MSGNTDDRGDAFIPTDDELDTATAKDEAVNGKDDEGTDKGAAGDDKGTEKAAAADDKKDEEKKDEEKKEDEGKPEKKIPEKRFNEAIRKYKDREDALKARITELEKGVSNTKVSVDIEEAETKIDELQDAYEDAIADNNKAKAKEIRGKIRAYERSLIDLKASEKAMAAKAETLEELRYEAAIDRVEADYPIINQDSEEFDADKAAEVLDLRNAMMRSGLSAAKALAKAVKYVLGEPNTAKSKQEVDATKADRETKAREKAADANSKQPPDTTRVGLDSDKAGGDQAKAKSVAKMSQDQFAKLDEETLSKLRGDSV